MRSPSNFSVDTEKRQAGIWASIMWNGYAVWQMGPYGSQREAKRSARFRLAQHYCGSHRLNTPAEEPMVERTAAGPQYVLPCVPKSSLGDLAQRVADTPLKSHAVQKPCDIGLFSDAADQIDIEDLTRR